MLPVVHVRKSVEADAHSTPSIEIGISLSVHLSSILIWLKVPPPEYPSVLQADSASIDSKPPLQTKSGVFHSNDSIFIKYNLYKTPQLSPRYHRFSPSICQTRIIFQKKFVDHSSTWKSVLRVSKLWNVVQTFSSESYIWHNPILLVAAADGVKTLFATSLCDWEDKQLVFSEE